MENLESMFAVACQLAMKALMKKRRPLLEKDRLFFVLSILLFKLLFSDLFHESDHFRSDVTP